MKTTGVDVDRLTEERFVQMQPFGRRPRGKRRPVDGSGLPSGPQWHPLLQSVALLRFRHRFLPWLQRRYGDEFTLRILPGDRRLVVHSQPDRIKQIFAGDPAVCHAGKANAVLGPVMGEHSLLLVDGAEHQRARRLLMPAFNGHALRDYAPLVTEVARAEVASWTDGATLRALDRMNALTLEVILRVVFGVTDEHRLERLRPVVRRTVEVSPAILLGWGWPRLRTLGPWRRAAENQHTLDRLVYGEITDRRAAGDLADRDDVLSRLIRVDTAGDRLTDHELRDQLVTLLLAGHETTATALAWAIYELGRDRAALARAQAAADTGDDAYLEAVFKESLRLHPVIPMVVRHLMAPTVIGGRELPTGSTVAASILLAHRRPESHPDAEHFQPERFHGTNPPANTWIPFGGGVRRCIGAGFSVMEGVTVLREIITTYDLEAVGSEKPMVRNITSIPRRHARTRMTRRG